MIVWGTSTSTSLTKGKGGTLTCSFNLSFPTACDAFIVTPTGNELFGWNFVSYKSVSSARVGTYITADASGTKTSAFYYVGIGH